MRRDDEFYLSSKQTGQSSPVRQYSSRFTRPENEEQLEELAQSVFSSLELYRFECLCNFRSRNPRVCARIAEARRGKHGLESSGFDFTVSPQDHDQFIQELVCLSLGGIRSAHQLLQDRLVVSAAYPCSDYATLLLAVLRHHDIPCRYVHVFNTQMHGHTALTEAMVGNELLMVRLSMQYNHKVWRGPVEDNMRIPPYPVAKVVRTKDCWSAGIDPRKAGILYFFNRGLDCRQIDKLAAANLP